MSSAQETAPSPIERLGHRFEESKALQGLLAALNRLPLPFERMPVVVNYRAMYAHTFDRFVALWLWKLFGLEAAESALLAELCRPGMQALDIGSNIGLHTLQLAHLVGEDGRVYAFEADRGNFETLRRNIRENAFAQVEPVHAAVGARSGETFVFKSGANSGDHRVFDSGAHRLKDRVRMLALDNYFPPGTRIDFIKMDIQGAEGIALQGMRRVLTENRDLAMLVEFWPFGLRQAGCVPAEVLAGLQALGFALEVLDERPAEQRRIGDPAQFVNALASGQYLNLLARRPAATASHVAPQAVQSAS
ncbi:MAG: FkbM family methyltransferase [Planctomycetes bacterium]|nr:FkbM family methyltransferase [Planctomycetota bacterium]